MNSNYNYQRNNKVHQKKQDIPHNNRAHTKRKIYMRPDYVLNVEHKI